MTDAEWLSCEFSTPMLEHVRNNGIGSWRKRFLLALACSRRVASVMSPEGLIALAVAERFVAGEATEAERDAAFDASGTAMSETINLLAHKADYCAYRLVQLAAERTLPATWNDDLAAWIAQTAPEAFAWKGLKKWDEPILFAHRREIADWVRDIFGNPFRPVTIDPSWRTPGVLSLARRIQDAQSFDHMPSLADALEDSGWERPACRVYWNQEILGINVAGTSGVAFRSGGTWVNVRWGRARSDPRPPQARSIVAINIGHRKA